MNFYRAYGKRWFDVLFSLLFLITFSWLYVVIFLMYLLTGNLPVFYVSLRMGKNGKAFRMIKFRTLLTDEKLPLHQRTFWLGKLLRKTNLDELPQVWHVLKGEMSWVGPRPLPLSYEGAMTETQRMRHTVLPGITGLSQVNGKNNLSWEKKFEYDLQYIKWLSFIEDLKILFRTLVEVFKFRRDVSLEEKPLTHPTQNF